jgi:hypothetical protein
MGRVPPKGYLARAVFQLDEDVVVGVEPPAVSVMLLIL